MNFKKIEYKCSIASALILLACQSLFAQKLDVDKLQGQIKTTVSKVLPASVFLIDYYPGPFTYMGLRSSGVVVKDGMILTAGHATIIGKKYRVVFSNGKECTATGVGKITSSDAGLLKINEEGEWPSAEMGSSAALTLNQPCFSIAYPGSFQPHQAVLRFGHVAELNSEQAKGKVRTTCLMEPGDSGGPVFDLEGRVIGIRSSILLELEKNFEVPVDDFRAYWTALQKNVVHKVTPVEDKLDITQINVQSPTIKSVEGLEKSLQSVEAKLDDYCVNISSSTSAGAITVFGTVVATRGFTGNFQYIKSLVVSKSSLVGENPTVSLPNGNSAIAKVLARNEQNDLVLLKLDKVFKGIDLTAISKDSLSLANLGDLLISPSPLDDGEISVLGSRRFDIARIYTNTAFLGAGFVKKEDKILINMLVPFAPAEIAKLEKNDEVISVNGEKITAANQFSILLRDKKPDDQITVVITREGVESSHRVKLGKRPASERKSHVAEKFTDGKSERMSGFTGIFVHDGKIKPSECGGPLFDAHKRFIGINIARYSRTSSIAFPALEIKKFIQLNLPGAVKI